MFQFALVATLLVVFVKGQATPAPVDAPCHDTITVGIGDLGSDCVFGIPSTTLAMLGGEYDLLCNDLVNDPDCTNYATSDGQPVWESVNNDGSDGCTVGSSTFYAIVAEFSGQVFIYTEYINGGSCETAIIYLDADLTDVFEFNPVGTWCIDSTSSECAFADGDCCDSCDPEASLYFDDCDGFGVSDEDFPMDPNPPSPATCETAFAKRDDSICFIDDGFNRWGWRTECIGFDCRGDTFDIYAGAGQCSLSAGSLVGTATLTVFSGVTKITVTAASGCFFEEIHAWIDAEPYPTVGGNNKASVAPGQMNIQDNANGVSPYSFINQINAVFSDYNFILHVVSCC